MAKTLGLLTVILSITLQSVLSEKCGPQGYICTGETTLRLCKDNHPFGAQLVCSSGYCDEYSPDVCIPNLPTTTIETTMVTKTTEECYAEGRYPVPGSVCKNYTLCILLSNGTYSVAVYPCPGESHFDPAKQKCTMQYECSENQSTTTLVETSAPGSTETSFITTTSSSTTPVPKCHAEGRFPTPDSNCKNYTLCILLSNGTYSVAVYPCPGESHFDPAKQKCTMQYECSENQSTTITVETSTPGSTETSFITTTSSSTTPVPKCHAEGRFPTPGSNCKNYTLCILLSNGTYSVAVYPCPGESHFDPAKQKCTMQYECSENQSTTNAAETSTPGSTETSFITTTSSSTTPVPKCHAEGRFPTPDSNCKNYTLCILLSNGTYSVAVYPCPGESHFDPAKQKCTMQYECSENQSTTTPVETSTPGSTETSFITTTSSSTTPAPKCHAEGRFPTPGSNCKNYTLCILLSNGTYSVAVYPCPGESHFDPAKQKCTMQYECSENQSTTNAAETSTPGSTETSLITTTSSSTTPVPKCHAEGRFPTPESNCKNYTLCILLSNGTYSVAVYPCPGESHFDPAKQKCTMQYECSENQSTTTPIETSTPGSTETSFITTTSSSTTPVPKCHAEGRFPTPGSNCKNYTLCILLSNGTYSVAVYPCPGESHFDPAKQKCTMQYECSENQSTTTPVETSTPGSTETSFITTTSSSTTPVPKCHAEGRFPTPGSNCKNYTLCILLSNGTYSVAVYPCPGESHFDPAKQKCTMQYECSENQSTTTPIETSTPGSTETSFITTTSSSTTPVPKCHAEGRFLTPGSNCKNYTLCILLSNGTYSVAVYPCPGESHFDPAKQKCTMQYECSENQSTTTPIETSTPGSTETSFITTTSSSTTPVPKCHAEGRFPTPGSNCKNYTLCILLSNGTYSVAVYPCPGESHFDPAKQKCTMQYECSENQSTTTPIETSTPGSTETSFITTTSSSTTPVPKCHAEGRFPTPGSNCKNYTLCILLSNGTYSVAVYPCPGESHFDPAKQKCTMQYECSENQSTTTPVETSTPGSTETSFITTTSSSTTPAPECHAEGRFPTPGSNCKNYTLCILLSNGTYSVAVYPCPGESYFDPAKQKCTMQYECSENQSTTTPVETSTPGSTETSFITTTSSSTTPAPECHAEGRFPTPGSNCKNYTLCILLSNGTYSVAVYPCPGESHFDPAKQKCTMQYECSENQSTTTPVETSTPGSTETSFITTTSSSTTPAPECHAEGRFPTPGSNCKNYTLCILLSNGTYSVAVYPCPGESHFDPAKQKCTMQYECSENQSTTTPVETSTPGSTETSFITTTSSSTTPVPKCHAEGRFPTPGSNCKNYTLCILLSNGTYSVAVYPCPGESHFDPAKQKCTMQYECSENQSTTNAAETSTLGSTETSLITTTSSSTTPVPKCHAEGRFPTPDSNCKNYTLCILLSNGTYSVAVYPCPGESHFDPAKQKCTMQYECSENQSTTTAAETSTPGSTVTSFITTTISSTTPAPECHAEGRFPTPGSNCKNYTLCILLSNGTYSVAVYPCPGESHFDPEKQKCTMKYDCCS